MAMSDKSPHEPAHRYDANKARELEARWQAYWDEHATFRVPNPGQEGFDASKPKFYVLDMFPYPSSAGLHVGHPEGYTATDIVARYKRLRGFQVLHPMGWDAFGLPAEQYALQTGVHPAKTTRTAIDNFRRQLKRFGFAYDWSREFATIDPDYYRWTQWIFLQIYHAWFDPETNRARPIAELIDEFESGKRPIRINPDAAERSAEDKQRTWDNWEALDERTRRDILDSWRLAYLGEQIVNWCPKLGTALANEEVIDGKSERGFHPVVRKPLKQWLFRITAYAERLLRGLDDLDWPDSTKARQTAWIGRSEGADVDFALTQPRSGFDRIRVYTTRPDTLFGATYMVLAPEHPLVDALLAHPAAQTDTAAVRAYVEQARNRSDMDRQLAKEKTGVHSGLQAVNPATGETIPVWIADYVLMGYGHGAIMAVPAHDERDWEFAKAFGLEIRHVVEPAGGPVPEGCFSGEGRNQASRNDEVSLNGLPTAEAKRTIVAWLQDKGFGHGRVNYKLRDWLFSRQRYWGEPFPLVFDEHGQHHAISADKLPLTLPELPDYQPEESDEPRPLLAKAQSWVHTTASEAGVPDLPPEAPVTRETNTMPGWAGSCWYHLRYCDPENHERLVGRDADHYWMGERGVDLYIGGAEHGVLHLLYARFWHMVLHDLGHVVSDEPYRKLFHQGTITSYAFQREDKTLVAVDLVDEPEEGVFVERETKKRVERTVHKMSKSLKNIINPDDILDAYGADTFRLYEMYMGPLEASKPWNTTDTMGMLRFLQRTWRLVVDERTGALRAIDRVDPEVEKQLHRAIAKVAADIDKLAFNTAIAALIAFVNAATASGGLTRDQIDRLAVILSPFAPHMAEEIWHLAGHQDSVAEQRWPEHDPAQLRDEQVEIAVQVNGKVRARMEVSADADKQTLERRALEHEKIAPLLEGKSVRRVVVVPGRMVNVVAN